MVKTLTKVGNSKALIIPSELIKKYGLKEVILEETDEGILIKSAVATTHFQKAVIELREKKYELYRRIESQANDPETIAHYGKPENNFSEADLDLIEE